MTGTRPPDAPDWIAAPLPAGEAATYTAPVVTAAPPPVARASRTVVAAMVALGLVGAIAGGAVSATLHRDAAATTSPTITATPALPPTQRQTPFAPPTPFAQSPNATTAANVPAGIVDIDTSSTITGLRGAGTGMILTSTGDVLTNNHVIEGATTIVVTRTDTGQTYNATVVGTDSSNDVALLHLTDATGLPTIPVGNSDTVSVDDTVVAAGNALGQGGAPAVVTGTVRGLDKSITVADELGDGSATLHGLIQTDAPLVPGDSGGPMFDDTNKVIGINTAASRGFRGGGNAEGFAVPINTAITVVEQIRAGVETGTIHIGVRGFLGVSTVDAANQGARVQAVQSDSPASNAGITVGDIITTVDGTRVSGAAHLSDLIHSHKPNATITVTWMTGAGDTKTSRITLTTGAAD